MHLAFMIAPSALQQLYNDISSLMLDFKNRVEPLLRGAAYASGGRFIEGRIKPLESVLLKLHKEARPSGLADLTDLFAATIVVPNSTRIPNLRNELSANFLIEGESGVKTTRPEEFIYDEPHLFLRLNTPLVEERLARIVFELQVKTEMQSASASVARSLAYKTKSLSWVKARLAGRIRALVEMVDELLARISEDAEEQEHLVYKLFADRNEIIAVCRECFSEAELPDDLRRLSVIVSDQLWQCKPKLTASQLRELLMAETFRTIREAQSISIIDKIFIALYGANKITANYETGQLYGDRSYLITDEMITLCPELKAIPEGRRVVLSWAKS